jgi:type IV secretory pathway TrbD component
MGAEITPVIALAFTGVLLMIVFAFVSVVIWTEARRKEREALYRSELLKKLAETPGPGAEAVLRSLDGEQQRKHGRRREYITLGGLLCAALGLAVLVGHLVTPDTRGDGVWAVGFVPLLLGAALIGHARLVMARPAGHT